jgi:hypothetical protein
MIGREYRLYAKLGSVKHGATYRLGTGYEYGMLPPRYPVPAIREWYEFGRQLAPVEGVVLIHVHCGRYPD